MRDLRTGTAGRRSKKLDAKAVQYHVDHFAQAPHKHARALRDLGMSPDFIRAIHKSSVPDARNSTKGSVGKRLSAGLGNFTGVKVVDRTLQDLGQAGLYAIPSTAITAKSIGTDVYAALPKTKGGPEFKRTRKIGTTVAKQTYEDLRHPLRHPGYTLLDALAVASAGAGTAARVGASGRALRAGEGIARAATRKGHEGGSLLHAPEPGTIKLRVGETTVEKPLSRNALRRAGQRARYAKKQERLDSGPVAEPGSSAALRAAERHASPEATVGREMRANRRIDQAHAHGELLHQVRQVKRLSRGEHVALRVVAIEGNRALARPGQVVGRHIATHQRFINEGEDVAAHQAQIRDLKLAARVLADPSDRFTKALEATRELANLGEHESIHRGFLSAAGAETRKQEIARVYSGDAGEGAFYFHAGKTTGKRKVGRFYNPRPSETGVGKVTPARHAPELGRQFTGKGIRRGFVPIDIPKTVAQAYGRRVHLHSAHDLYETLQGASTATRESRYQVPIRSTTSISKRLKRYLSTVEENLHATPEELRALTGTEVERLKQELEAAEHGSAPLGANIKGVRWVDQRFLKDLGDNSVRGPIERAADAINNPARILTLYLRPAYMLNALGNAGMLAVTQGHHLPHALWEAARAKKIHGAKNTAYIDSLVGTGRSLGQAVDTGLLHRGSEALANAWNTATDVHARRAAFLAEARRAGFNTPPKLERLLHNEKHRAKLREVTRRARKSIGDFDSLTPVEKNTIRRLIYFYPWLRVATQWTGHMVAEHPTKSAVLAENSRAESDHAAKILGKLPQWARQAGLVPIGKEKGGMVDTINPGSVNTPASAVQTLGAIPNTVRAAVGLKTKGTVGLGDLLTPAAQLLTTAGGQASDSSRRTGLLGALEGTSSASTLRRLGVYGKPSKTFPETGAKAALGPFAVGGLAPRATDLEELHKQARQEERAGMSKVERVRDTYETWHHELAHAVHATGHKQIPPEVIARLAVRQERAEARAEADDPIAGDVDVLVRHGLVTKKEAAVVKQRLSRATDRMRQGLERYMTMTYFDPGGLLAGAIAYLRSKGADINLPPLGGSRR